MGVSTDAVVCFGVDFGEDAEFPWITDESDDIEEWWREIRGFVPPPEPEWGERDEANERKKAEYFAAQRAWDAAHPIPIEVVYHCSHDYTMYILAVKGSELSARQGYPETINPAMFSEEPDATALCEFCREFEIELPSEPKWLLCSYWG